jgi:PilZ domain-containing protein
MPVGLRDRRREERFATKLPIRLEGGEAGVVLNVNASGVYFVTDVALEEGQAVSFTVEFRDSPSGPIAVNCVAQIVRREEQGAGRGVGASISSFEFRRLDAPAKSSR